MLVEGTIKDDLTVERLRAGGCMKVGAGVEIIGV